MTTNTTTASQPNAAPSVQSDAVKSLAARLVAAGVTRFFFTRGTDESATPERIAQAINYALDQIEAGNADLACDVCNGTGQVCVGTSGQESDGNGPVMEACPECAYFDAAAPALPEPAAAQSMLEIYASALKDIADACNCCGDRSDLSTIAADALAASPQSLAEVSAAQAVPEGCAVDSNGTVYHDVAETYHQAECSEAFHMWLDDQGAPRNDDDEQQFSLVGRIARLPTLTQAQAALQHALNICDSVPTRLHLSIDETDAQIGRLVNVQESGFHGYAVIRDALTAVSALTAAAPVAQPPDTTREA